MFQSSAIGNNGQRVLKLDSNRNNNNINCNYKIKLI
jgi:hypothetical protein